MQGNWMTRYTPHIHAHTHTHTHTHIHTFYLPTPSLSPSLSLSLSLSLRAGGSDDLQLCLKLKLNQWIDDINLRHAAHRALPRTVPGLIIFDRQLKEKKNPRCRFRQLPHCNKIRKSALSPSAHFHLFLITLSNSILSYHLKSLDPRLFQTSNSKPERAASVYNIPIITLCA